MKKNTNFTRQEMRGVPMNDYLKHHQKLADDSDLDLNDQQEHL